MFISVCTPISGILRLFRPVFVIILLVCLFYFPRFFVSLWVYTHYVIIIRHFSFKPATLATNLLLVTVKLSNKHESPATSSPSSSYHRQTLEPTVASVSAMVAGQLPTWIYRWVAIEVQYSIAVVHPIYLALWLPQLHRFCDVIIFICSKIAKWMASPQAHV